MQQIDRTITLLKQLRNVISPLDLEDINRSLLCKCFKDSLRVVKNKSKWEIKLYYAHQTKKGNLIWKYCVTLLHDLNKSSFSSPEEAWKFFGQKGEPKIGSLHNKKIEL